MQWDARRLVVLSAIAEHGSFTRAAEALAMTQPAVSRQLAALERELGVALVSRGPRHVAPTPAGAALLAEAESLVPAIEAVQRRMSAFGDPHGGAVRVGAVPSALAAFLPDAFSALRMRRPHVQVSVEEGWSTDLARRTARGALDMAVISSEARPASLPWSSLLREPFVAVLAERNPLAGQSRLRLSDLADEPWLVATEPGGRRAVMAACAGAGFSPRIIGTATWHAAGPLIAAGLGVALAPRSAGARLCSDSAVVVRSLGEAPERELVLVRARREATPVEGDLERELRRATARPG